MKKTNMLCAYCNTPRDGEMLLKYDYSMGSEYTGKYNENIDVKIECHQCKKLLYQKNQDI